MHQVERIGRIAQPLHRRPAQETIDTQRGARRSGDHDRGSRAQRPQDDPAREDTLYIEHDAAQDHARQPDPAERDAGPLGRSHEGNRQGEQRAERELPQSRPGVKIGVLLVGFGDVDRIGQRAGEEQAEQHRQHPHRTPAHLAADQPRQPEDQRPDQEDLALHGQRPEMLEGRGQRFVGGIVIGLHRRQLPVLHIEQSRQPVPPVGPDRPLRVPQTERDRGQQDRCRGQRQQPFEGVQPVTSDRQRSAILGLTDE